MSEAGKNQEPSMEEILASIRRIIAEDEAGRARAGAGPVLPRGGTDRDSRPVSRTPSRTAVPETPAARPAPAPQGDMVLDLTNMVAADGSVVSIAPNPQSNSRIPQQPMTPPPLPSGFEPSHTEQQTTPYGGFSRRPPPPGPGAEPRTQGFAQPASFAPPPSFQPPPMQPVVPSGFASPDPHSRGVQKQGGVPLPPNLSEDSPSRRVFKRRHTAGSAFAELAQTGFVPAAPDQASGFGKVPVGAVATELDMNPAPPPPMQYTPPSFASPEPFPAAAYAPPPVPPQAAVPPLPPAPPPAPAALSEEQVRAAVASAAEPVIRAWLDANLSATIEQLLGTLVQAKVEEAIAANLTQTVDQRIHQNVESNLGPYIEDRVGAHVDARLAAAVEEKVTAVLKQQVAAAVNQQIAQAVTQHVTSTVREQLQGTQQNLTRVVDERVKSEIRSLFQRLAGN